MKDLIRKIQRSEFLTLNELLRVKVTVVMFFLLFFGAFIIPISFFENLGLGIRIIVPTTFILLFTITFLLLMFDKSRVAMHFSIYTFIGLTVYYVGGSGQLYGFFLLFITLTVIIFFQDITTYIIYGGALTIYGVIFIQISEEVIINLPDELVGFSASIYQIILIAFFVIYLLQFILTDTFNESLNEDYLKTSKANKLYLDYIVKYTRELQDRNDVTPLQEDNKFKKTTRDLAVLINQELAEPSDNIEEVVEYYFFIHKYELKRILKSENISKSALKYAKSFEKFRIDRNSDLLSLCFKTEFQLRDGLSVYIQRYNQKIDKLFTNRTNKIIALSIIYLILNNQITQVDQWGRVNKILNHDEILKLVNNKDIREFLTFEDVNFISKNAQVFKETL